MQLQKLQQLSLINAWLCNKQRLTNEDTLHELLNLPSGGSIKFLEPCPMFPLCTQHHITDSHRSLADLPHLLYFRATLLSALSLIVSKLVESCFSRNPPTYTHQDECTLFNYTGSWGNTSMQPDFSYQQRYSHHFHPSLGDANPPLSLYGWRMFISTLLGWRISYLPSLGDAFYFHLDRSSQYLWITIYEFVHSECTQPSCLSRKNTTDWKSDSENPGGKK